MTDVSSFSFRNLTRIADLCVRLRDEPHHVTFHETGWELEHTLPCRVAGMRNCPIYATLDELDEAPLKLGRYAVVENDDQTLVYSRPSGDDPADELLRVLKEEEEVSA